MPIFKGPLSVRRYTVEGDSASARDRLMQGLTEHAFREPLSPVHKEELGGWCLIHNLLDTDFSDSNQYLYNQYATFGLRVEKKTVPSKLFRAHLQKKFQAWCKEHGRDRVPAKVKEEIKELLELDMLRQTLPKVALHEVGWNLNDGWVLFHNQSEGVNDRFRKLFYQSFGLALRPFTPLDYVFDLPDQQERLMAAGTTELKEVS
jgi:DNA recombination-dependent growth factor C